MVSAIQLFRVVFDVVAAIADRIGSVQSRAALNVVNSVIEVTVYLL
jgi:hypothetical protein